MSSLKSFLLLLFCIALIAADTNKKTEKTPQQHTITKNQPQQQQQNPSESQTCDFSSQIESIQSKLSQLDSNEVAMSKLQTELTKINERLQKFEKKQSDLGEVEKYLDLLNKLVNELSSRVDKMESATSSKKDSGSAPLAMEEEIKKFRSSIDREINDNKRRLDFIEENGDLEQLKKDLAVVRGSFQIHDKQNVKYFEEIKERFSSLEKSMVTFNNNLQDVYDSTLGAALAKIVNITLDYLADFGGFCIYMMDVIINYIKSINWKGYYDAITDPKQQQLFKKWVLSLYKYSKFWWINAIQPAIMKQVIGAYYGIQQFVKDSIVFIHQHVLYKELVNASKQYLEMVNIPLEFTGMIIDGILGVSLLSSLITLSFILGFFCDCICPQIGNGNQYKPHKKQQKSQQQKQETSTKKKRKRKK